MKIAFLIEAHEDIEHLQKLVDSLKPHDVFIHWDAKSGDLPDIKNAMFTNERKSVFWAGFSQVEATMELIKIALAQNINYDKYVLISGSCYPIKKINELEKYFKNDNNKNYLKAIKVRDADFLSSQVSKRIWRDNILPLNTPRTKILNKITNIK